MVRVMVEVRVKSTVPVSVRVRNQKTISRDCSLASELVQAKKHTLIKHETTKFKVNLIIM